VRCALGELSSALRRSDSTGSAAPSCLVLASERRIPQPASTQEMIFGDGAAGALVGHGASIATYVASASTYADLVDHFRQTSDDYEYSWEERWVRDEGYMKVATGTLRQCLTNAGVNTADVSHFAM